MQATGPLTPLEGGYLCPPGRIALLHPFGDTAFHRQGWNSWSPSGWTRLSAEPLRIRGDPARLQTADDAAADTPHAHSGSAVGAIEGLDGNVLLLGALGLGSPRVGADRNTLWGSAERGGAEWFLACGPEEQVFARYAELVAARLGRRTAAAGAVWSSWYSYYEAIDERLIARTVDGLRGLPFDVVQLDDGWEAAVGDWTANERFSSGMAATAATIASAGFRPGLWLAPLIALPGSRIARERPDLMVQGDDGRPQVTGTNWDAGYHSLDTTQPEVLDHLAGVLRGAVDAGFTYLKLDFMYAGAVPGRRSRDVQREQVYRDAVQHIRAVVGDDVYLLGSGVPMLPSVGVFDGARVGPDVAAFWDNLERTGDPSGSGARNAIVAAVHRTWMRPWFQLDPDAAYFRRIRSLLDDDQRQQLQDVAAILGFKSTSDPAAWLSSAERDELDAWLRADERIERTGRYTWAVDGRVVDLGAVVAGTAPAAAATLVE